MKYITLQSKMPSLVAFLLSILFVMVGCDEPSKPSTLAAPVITKHPASQTVAVGSTATLSVAVTALTGVTFTYQWQKAAKGKTDFTDVVDATSASYTTPTLTLAESGTQYKVVVTATNTENLTNTATSSVATITVSTTPPPAAPVITTQPASQTIEEGNTATLSVVVTALTGATFTYQWQKAAKGKTDFTDVVDATDASYTTPTLTLADSGTQYKVVVTATNTENLTSNTASNIATLSVQKPSNSIVWTHIDGTKHYADIPADGILLSSTLTATATDIRSVDIIPRGITSIGEHAFEDCTALASVSIPSSVTRIESYAFYNCTGLTSITMQRGVSSIGSFAFSNCKSLTSITIPNSVSSIEGAAFSNCKSLTSVRVEATTAPTATIDIFRGTSLIISVPDASVGAYKTAWSAYAGRIYGYNDVAPVIGKVVWTHTNGTKQYSNAPTNGILLASILTTTKADIKSVDTIPSDITSIGNLAFENCSKLTSITIPSSITSIRNAAFSGCSSLANVSIPNSVTSIEGGAFSGCSSLTNISIPSSVTSISDLTFQGCTALTSITIPSGVTYIGGSVFRQCTSLSSISIPSSVTNIGVFAFDNCTALTSITIPSSVTSIGAQAFLNCSGLTSVRVEATTPPTAGMDMFLRTHANLSITVPSASVAAYKATSNWSSYASKISGY